MIEPNKSLSGKRFGSTVHGGNQAKKIVSFWHCWPFLRFWPPSRPKSWSFVVVLQAQLMLSCVKEEMDEFDTYIPYMVSVYICMYYEILTCVYRYG